MRTITAHGKQFKLGRNRPIARGPRLSLKNYLKRTLPSPPPSIDYTEKAKASLNDIYLNDQLGDCVIAGIGHVAGVLTANAGSPLVLTSAQIIALYSKIGGYVPGDPSTDQGCDEQTALNWWQQNGLPGHKITGWMAVNAADPVEVRIALWLFENLIFGVELPDAWVNPMPSASGFHWDVAGDPDPDNGHCFVSASYGASNVGIATWGMWGVLSNAAVAKYAGQAGGGELYTVISEDAIAKASQKAPNGFDWTQLLADFDSMKG